MRTGLCRCKCGEKPAEGKQFVKGHVVSYREKVFKLAANSAHPKQLKAAKIIDEFDWHDKFEEWGGTRIIVVGKMALCPKCQEMGLTAGDKGQPVCNNCGFDHETAGPWNVPNSNAPYECTTVERRRATKLLEQMGIEAGNLSILEVRGIIDEEKLDGVPLTEIGIFGAVAP